MSGLTEHVFADELGYEWKAVVGRAGDASLYKRSRPDRPWLLWESEEEPVELLKMRAQGDALAAALILALSCFLEMPDGSKGLSVRQAEQAAERALRNAGRLPPESESFALGDPAGR